MPWDGSTRRDRLPPTWATEIVPTVLARDSHRCQIQLPGCTGTATEVDHIRRGDDHRLINLQGACEWCHARKSSAEGNAARIRYARHRPPEQHPGVL